MQVTKESYDPLKNLGIGYHAFFKTQNFICGLTLMMLLFAIVIMVGYYQNCWTNLQFVRSLQIFSISQGLFSRNYCF